MRALSFPWNIQHLYETHIRQDIVKYALFSRNICELIERENFHSITLFNFFIESNIKCVILLSSFEGHFVS
jgi:hypothetical protein